MVMNLFISTRSSNIINDNYGIYTFMSHLDEELKRVPRSRSKNKTRKKILFGNIFFRFPKEKK